MLEFEQYDPRGVRQFQSERFDWCALSGSSTSTTPGEFASSSLEVLLGALPRMFGNAMRFLTE